MTIRTTRGGTGKRAALLAAAAGMAFVLPSAVSAIGGQSVTTAPAPLISAPFTPASVDPVLAKRVAESLAAKGLDLRFTPASNLRDRTVTVAVRVNDNAAQAISARGFASRSASAAVAQGQPGTATVAIAPTRYNLGIARGYQGFAQSSELVQPGAGKSKLSAMAAGRRTLPASIKSVDMPDLADFKPSPGAADKPSRFKSRIALDQESPIGRSPQTRGSLGDQSFDLGGAFRVTRNLDVTAGVVLSQDRDRIDPVTDNVQDSQSVYVGTQFRF
ncbi:MAG: hypothetical protein WA948_08040 [Pontixanthobacter sp.]